MLNANGPTWISTTSFPLAALLELSYAVTYTKKGASELSEIINAWRVESGQMFNAAPVSIRTRETA